MNKPKLIIHETDYHGCGNIYYNGKIDYYSYDEHGNVKLVVEQLIDLGFINKDDVAIFDNSYDMYKIVEKGLMNND
jgi:hypothetical protein